MKDKASKNYHDKKLPKSVVDDVVSDKVKKTETKSKFSNEKDSKFIFRGGYSEERTKAEIQKEDLTFDKFGNALIDDPVLIELFEHDCSLHQDNNIDDEKTQAEKSSIKK